MLIAILRIVSLWACKNRLDEYKCVLTTLSMSSLSQRLRLGLCSCQCAWSMSLISAISVIVMSPASRNIPYSNPFRCDTFSIYTSAPPTALLSACRKVVGATSLCKVANPAADRQPPRTERWLSDYVQPAIQSSKPWVTCCNISA